MLNKSQLEELYTLLNKDFFNDVSERPTINIINSTRTYAHYKHLYTWIYDREVTQRELNVSSAFLQCDLTTIVLGLLREMCKQYGKEIDNVQTVSRSGVYYNSEFARIANAHGLICLRTSAHGWSDISSNISSHTRSWIDNLSL